MNLLKLYLPSITFSCQILSMNNMNFYIKHGKQSHILQLMIMAVLLILPLFSFGQSINESQLNKKEAKLFSEAKSLARKGNPDKSIKTFEKLLKKQPLFTEGYLRLGAQYNIQKNYSIAEELFSKAIQLDPDFDPEMYYSLAQIQSALNKYLSAAENLNTYIQLTSDEIKKNRSEKQRDNLIFTDYALKNPVPFEPHNVGDAINTENSEYSPILTVDGSRLIFTRNVHNLGEYIGQEDIFVSVKDGDNWEKAIPLNDVNTPQNEGAFAISGDGRYIVFTACDRKDSYGSCDLYFSMFLDGQWTPSINMGHVVNSAAWDSHPTLSVDGRTLIFASRRLGTYGGNDLWMTKRDENGSWMVPWNMGPVLNSTGDDESPFLHPDGKTLYFRSNGRPGMGKFDIYFSRLDDETGEWGEPVNLGYPINSPGDEGALTLSLDGKTAWYASDMDYLNNKKLDNLDIFTFELYETARPLPTSYVKGYVTDAVTNQTLKAVVSVTDLKTGSEIFNTQTTVDGYFISALPSERSYACFVEAVGYAFYSENFDLSELTHPDEPRIINIHLQPIIEKDSLIETAPIVLNNIFFESGSADLKKESAFEIDRIASLLRDNPGIDIKITGHTDSVGSDEDNLVLSLHRARSVVEAIIAKGIDASRLAYEGKGEQEPLADNDTEEGRKLNRRTEMMIIYRH